MKSVATILILLLLLSPMLSADEKTCPAHRAAEMGHNPFEAFHAIMAPTWHGAWPDKDYDALLAAGPKFREAFEAIMKLEPEHKTEARQAAFLKQRKEFGELINEYATAAEKGEKEKVYELMPAVHDAFEATASTLLPVYYPEFEGLVITLNLIRETHLPKDNVEGIVGSTETLVAKADNLNEKNIPEELLEHKKGILTEFAVMKELITKMKDCCDKKEMEQYKEHAAALDKAVQAFIENYI